MEAETITFADGKFDHFSLDALAYFCFPFEYNIKHQGKVCRSLFVCKFHCIIHFSRVSSDVQLSLPLILLHPLEFKEEIHFSFSHDLDDEIALLFPATETVQCILSLIYVHMSPRYDSLFFSICP